MDVRKRTAIGLGVFGLVLIVLGIKFLPAIVGNALQPGSDRAVLLQLAQTEIARQPTDIAQSSLATQAAATPLPDLSGKPILLFFNLDEPCECMTEITARAERQMAGWPVERRGGVAVLRLAMEQHADLQARYQVFRSPCLVLLDAGGQIAWRQDYPLIEGGPFKLDELEAAIAALEGR